MTIMEKSIKFYCFPLPLFISIRISFHSVEINGYGLLGMENRYLETDRCF